ncbi:MAG: L-seryl-tRNA(Sec) selenium transferase [Anaerolineae bacterium]|nr:L-seryl-tRNA(Sec) selenium transferase [Anaerolineae bacterium]
MNDLKQLPSVERLLQSESGKDWVRRFGRPLTLEAIRSVLDAVRQNYREKSFLPAGDELSGLVEAQLSNWLSPTLLAVINASGVILHTNLGRAPLSTAALQAIQATSRGYCTLEYDLETGKRGTRLIHAEKLLTHLTGAQGALVVNNNAAAVLLVLSGLARRKRVVIARSQLVEIGGGFRIPDVLKQSGAQLLEVGTTNRVHLSDYEEAIKQGAAVVLRAHHSNFKIIGFTQEPTLAELCKLAEKYGVIVIDDLGSGALIDTAQYGLAHEPTVQESLAAGASLVCFSGDKLLGGPQAGIIVGRADLIGKLKKHPLARAIRSDKLCLAALTATLMHYIKDEAQIQIPVWRSIAMTLEEIQERAERWCDFLRTGQVIASNSTVGGGSLPEETLPTYVFALKVKSPQWFVAQLRKLSPPVIARLEDDQVLFDPRTVFPEQDEMLLSGLKSLGVCDSSDVA